MGAAQLDFRASQDIAMASYSVNERGVARARQLIEARQYVLQSEWGNVQPRAADENAFLASHTGMSTPNGIWG